jgi:heterodisulfide reductase subunit B
MCVCCAACFNRFKIANHYVLNDPEKRQKINQTLESDYKGEITVRHFLEILSQDYGSDNLGKKVVNKLEGLKVACYYGCLLVRPHKIMQFDDEENPLIMDKIMQATGAHALDWPGKVECCGASFSITKTDVVLRVCNDILQMAVEAGADCIAVGCPLCQSNLDLRQSEINKKYGKTFEIPVLYFTQVLGLALGIDWKKLGLDKHIVEPVKLLKAKNIIR